VSATNDEDAAELRADLLRAWYQPEGGPRQGETLFALSGQEQELADAIRRGSHPKARPDGHVVHPLALADQPLTFGAGDPKRIAGAVDVLAQALRAVDAGAQV
jgi:hypothetical protein